MNVKIILSVVVLVILSGLSYFILSSKDQMSNQTSPAPTISPSPTVSSPTNGPTPSIILTATPTTSAIKETSAIIKTSKGNIVISFYGDAAPKTVENFISKSKSGFYKNLAFHRVEDWVIQGGDPLANGTGGGTMKTELNDKPFVVGSVGVARGGDIEVSNDSQFFITKTDASWLNNQYTNFGIVTSGMEIVNKIEIGDKILQITLSN